MSAEINEGNVSCLLKRMRKVLVAEIKEENVSCVLEQMRKVLVPNIINEVNVSCRLK